MLFDSPKSYSIFSAHPNTVAFVSHAGMFGLQESLYHGVPLVTMPIFNDQLDNAMFVQERELGMKISNKNTFEATELKEMIQEVINNPK